MQQLRAISGGIVRGTDLDGASSGVTITANATLNTKGSYTELLASTPYQANAIILNFRGVHTPASTTAFLMDIAVGAGGSEVVIGENLIASSHTSNGSPASVITIVHPIPQGTRISARCQANPGSSQMIVQGFLNSSASQGSMDVTTTYGASTPFSGGTDVDPGAVANTKGAWAELGTSGPAGVRQLSIGVGPRLQDRAAEVTNWQIDIGIGAAGSEHVIVPDWPVSTSEGIGVILPVISPIIDVSIPSGTRIAARARSSSTAALTRIIDVIGYGVA